MKHISFEMAILSHLSDASIEVNFNPELAQKRINFVKYLIFHFKGDLTEMVSVDDLDLIWNEVNNPPVEFDIPDEEIERQIQEHIEADWNERDSVCF